MKVSGFLLGLALVATAAIPAAAQEVTGANAAMAVTATPVSFSAGDVTSANFALPADVSFAADDQRPGTANAPTHEMGGKPVLVMVQGGLITGGGATGFDLGVGASFKPVKDNNKFEVGADVNFVHESADGFGANGAYISFNGQYDFHMQHSRAVPFAGAGVGILHRDGFTDTDLQILGGVDFETAGGRAIRAQIRFVLTTETTTLVLVGFAF